MWTAHPANGCNATTGVKGGQKRKNEEKEADAVDRCRHRRAPAEICRHQALHRVPAGDGLDLANSVTGRAGFTAAESGSA